VSPSAFAPLSVDMLDGKRSSAVAQAGELVAPAAGAREADGLCPAAGILSAVGIRGAAASHLVVRYSSGSAPLPGALDPHPKKAQNFADCHKTTHLASPPTAARSLSISSSSAVG